MASMRNRIEYDRFSFTIDKMATQGRFSELTILWAKVDLPEPELPAMPIMLVSAQGGEYREILIRL